MIPHDSWQPNYAGLLCLVIFAIIFGAVAIIAANRESRRRKNNEARLCWKAKFKTRATFMKKFLEQYPEDTTPTPRAEDDDDR